MTDLDKLLQMASTDNISDELLAAYIDGNTSAEENEIIQASMPTEDLDDIKEIAQDSLSFEEQLHFYDGDYGYWELGIPPAFQHETLEEINNDENGIETSGLIGGMLDTNTGTFELSNSDVISDNFIISDSFMIDDNFHTDDITDVDDNNSIDEII